MWCAKKIYLKALNEKKSEKMKTTIEKEYTYVHILVVKLA